MTAPWCASSTSTVSISYGSHFSPSIILVDHARPAHGQLVAFAAHVLEQDGQVQFAAAGDAEHVGVLGVLDAQRDVGLQFALQALARSGGW